MDQDKIIKKKVIHYFTKEDKVRSRGRYKDLAVENYLSESCACDDPYSEYQDCEGCTGCESCEERGEKSLPF